MNKPTIYLDMDNVVFDTIGMIKLMYDDDFRLYSDYCEVPYEQIKSYNFSELKLLSTGQLIQYFNSGRFFDLVDCIEGAELSIATLNMFNMFPITFVSLGTMQNLRGKTEWVERFNKSFGTETVFTGVLSSLDKSSVDMYGGILVDDVIQNLETSNASVKICFGDYEWNKDWTGLRAKNWEELKQIILKESKRL